MLGTFPTEFCVNGATNETNAGAIGLAKGDILVIELSFDILSLEALFLLPRQARFRWMPMTHWADTG